MNNLLKEKLENIPQRPGCYLWKDINNNILYIGKSKNLKKRVNQYFKGSHNTRIGQLITNIYDLDYICVNSENESLILEANLIKKYKPKYNVLLIENNSYPYIVVTNQKDPKIIYTKNYKNIKGKAYGPFASKDNHIYELYKFLLKIIPLRKCNVLPKQKCIYYDLGQCLGPCINKISPLQYQGIKKDIDNIFKNKSHNLLEELKSRELKSSNELNFEAAGNFLELQKSLKTVFEKQIINLNKSIELDIVGYYANEEFISINIFNFIDGNLIAKHEHVNKYYNEVNETITSYLMQYYITNNIPKNIYINLDSENISSLSENLNTKMISPTKGKYHQLILSAIENAKQYLEQNILKAQLNYDRTIDATEKLSKIIKVSSSNYIEIIDNSNLFLETCVSAIVVYKNGFPDREMYRKYNIKNTNNKSDYSFTKEVIFRRYSKLLKENQELPNVLIVDGSKIQISAAIESLQELGIENRIKVIGLKKNSKHKTDSIICDGEEILIEKTSPLFAFLLNMQNEVHRFVITFFRDKRSKSQMTTFLDDIPGIGTITKEKILNLYPNIYDIDNADIEILKQLMPIKIAKLLKEKIKEELKDEK